MGGLVSDPVSRALNRVYNGTRMRAGHCPESRFVSPVSRVSRVFFYDCVDCELFTAVSIFIVRKKRKKKRRDLNLWRRSMISLGGKCGVENFQNDFLISYSPSKLESDLESFIVFVKLVSINRLVENARAIFQLR